MENKELRMYSSFFALLESELEARIFHLAKGNFSIREFRRWIE